MRTSIYATIFLFFLLNQNGFSVSKDYGIILIPDNKTMQEANNLRRNCLEQLATIQIIPKAKNNTPHISLHQLRVNEKDLPNLLKALKDVSKKINFIHFKMDVSLTNTEENIFWCSQEAKHALKRFHADILTATKSYQKLQHNFDPHITLVYNSENNPKIKFLINSIKVPKITCQVRAIALGELGPSGEVVKILAVIKYLDNG